MGTLTHIQFWRKLLNWSCVRAGVSCLLGIYKPLSFTVDASVGLFAGCRDTMAALCSAKSYILRSTVWNSSFSPYNVDPEAENLPEIINSVQGTQD